MSLDPETRRRLREQIRKEGFIDYNGLAAYLCWWANGEKLGAVTFTNSDELSEVECEDIVYVTNGINCGFAYTESDFYRKNVAPHMTAMAYRNAITAANKRPWWKRLLGIK